jgi:hypothetical protein
LIPAVSNNILKAPLDAGVFFGWLLTALTDLPLKFRR